MSRNVLALMCRVYSSECRGVFLILQMYMKYAGEYMKSAMCIVATSSHARKSFISYKPGFSASHQSVSHHADGDFFFYNNKPRHVVLLMYHSKLDVTAE